MIPPPGREAVLNQLHDLHPGIVKMKGFARSYVWWPDMSKALEGKVRNCQKCQQSRPTPAPAPLGVAHKSMGTNTFGLCRAVPRAYVLSVLVDAHSKWIEVMPVTTSSSTMTIENLRTVFATHGIPQKIVTDNGTQFTSKEFADFTRSNGIEHSCTAPYHPASNGLVERAVHTFKQGLQRITEGSLETRLARFLFQYRIIPHSTTGRSLAELLLGRQPTCRSRFDLLHPDGSIRVSKAKVQQKQRHDVHSRARGSKWVTKFMSVISLNYQPGYQVPSWNRQAQFPFVSGCRVEGFIGGMWITSA